MTDEWMKEEWYIYTVEYYSAIKTDKTMPLAATWMDLEIIILSQANLKKKNTIWYHVYVESEQWHKWTHLWVKDIENRLMVAKKGGSGRGMEWKFGLTDAN